MATAHLSKPSTLQSIAALIIFASLCAPASAAPRNYDCPNCPPPKRYDSQEVVKNTRQIDHSRVINTQSVVRVRPRIKETNHLVIHKNETRHVGVVRHNHTIIEKEVRYVRRVPAVTVVNFVTHQYLVVERPDTRTIPVAPPRLRPCYGYGRYGSCRTLRVRG